MEPEVQRRQNYAESSANLGQKRFDLDDSNNGPGGIRRRDRRTKDDQCERQHQCGCGKTYLSYAALYTHTKTKHNGIMQRGSQTASKRRIGRQKKDDYATLSSNSFCQKLGDFNKDFRAFLQMIPDAAATEPETDHKNITLSFPNGKFADESVADHIFKNLCDMIAELERGFGSDFLPRLESCLVEYLGGRSFNCNEAFALFLIYAYRFTSRAFFEEISFFVVAYQVMVNRYGWNKLKEMNVIGQVPKEQVEFTTEQSAEYLPDFCNVFLVQFYAMAFESNLILKPEMKLKFLGTDSVKLLRAILLTKQFCNWLWFTKFSKAKIEILRE